MAAESVNPYESPASAGNQRRTVWTSRLVNWTLLLSASLSLFMGAMLTLGCGSQIVMGTAPLGREQFVSRGFAVGLCLFGASCFLWARVFRRQRYRP